MEDLDVIKIGGSVIFGIEDTIRIDALNNIFEQLAKNQNNIIVTGSGESLHNLVYKYDLTDSPRTYNPNERETRAREVNKAVAENLLKISRIAEPHMWVTTFTPDNLFEKESRGRKNTHEIVGFKKYILDEIASYEVPIISGGIVPDRTLNYSAVSSDTIAAYLGEAYDSKRVILLTDVDGVYDHDSKLIKEVKSSEYAKYKGGMGDKIRRVGFAAKNRKVYIANGNNLENLGRIIEKDEGTFTRVL